MLPDQELNAEGVGRMCRMLAVLQPALGVLGGEAGVLFRPEAARAFERARTYYSLLTLPVEGLLRAATDKPTAFTPAEYLALLQVTTTTHGVPNPLMIRFCYQYLINAHPSVGDVHLLSVLLSINTENNTCYQYFSVLILRIKY